MPGQKQRVCALHVAAQQLRSVGFPLAVLKYWGSFTGGKLEYELNDGTIRALVVNGGDLVVMAGSQIKHGCGAMQTLQSGNRYASVEFYHVVANKKRSRQ